MKVYLTTAEVEDPRGARYGYGLVTVAPSATAAAAKAEDHLRAHVGAFEVKAWRFTTEEVDLDYAHVVAMEAL